MALREEALGILDRGGAARGQEDLRDEIRILKLSVLSLAVDIIPW